jgi:hypothetical protein
MIPALIISSLHNTMSQTGIELPIRHDVFVHTQQYQEHRHNAYPPRLMESNIQ